jgi:Bacterial sugar transferase
VTQNESVCEDTPGTYGATAVRTAGTSPANFLPPSKALLDLWRYRYVKRAIDLFFASAMAAFFVVPGIVIAATIVLDSRGPVFYREERIGRNGRRFRIRRRNERPCWSLSIREDQSLEGS